MSTVWMLTLESRDQFPPVYLFASEAAARDAEPELTAAHQSVRFFLEEQEVRS